MDSRSIARIRREYTQRSLPEEALPESPLPLIARWLEQAIASQCLEPTALALATSGADGRPSVRTVLLKGLEADQLHFFTSYSSAKAQQLAQNPWAAALFFWPELERQLRVEGGVAQLSGALSDRYFAARPRGSQLAAWASRQSQPIAHREELMGRVEELERRFADQPIPRPPGWGGFALRAQRVEFWQGGAHRLHDRIEYRRLGDAWARCRLAP